MFVVFVCVRACVRACVLVGGRECVWMHGARSALCKRVCVYASYEEADACHMSVYNTQRTVQTCMCVCVCICGDCVVRQHGQAQALFECRLHLMREGARRWIRAGTEALRWRQVCIDLSNTYSMYRLRKAVKVPSVLLPNSQVN